MLTSSPSNFQQAPFERSRKVGERANIAHFGQFTLSTHDVVLRRQQLGSVQEQRMPLSEVSATSAGYRSRPWLLVLAAFMGLGTVVTSAKATGTMANLAPHGWWLVAGLIITFFVSRRLAVTISSSGGTMSQSTWGGALEPAVAFLAQVVDQKVQRGS